MRKKIISTAVSLTMTVSILGGLAVPAQAAANVPQYQSSTRQMEKLNRGLVAVYRTADGRNVQSSQAGVYLSWRLLGDEPLESQEYDIYKNGAFLASTTGVKGTNYIDTAGKTTDTYKVVKKGTSSAEVAKQTAASPMTNHTAASTPYTDLVNSFAYMDIAVERPANVGSSKYYNDGSAEGGQNDVSVGDLDGDGDYEIVLKWDPTDSKDAASGGSTGPVYLDGYEIDPTNTDASKNANGHLYKWRINLGPHIRAGAHDTQFMVYDFDGDGRSEIMTMTAPGSIDGTGKYVSEVGDTEEIRNVDNSLIQLRKGKNIGPEYYTVFDGETGAALFTTDAIPLGREDGGDWGDSTMNRAYRYLAAVAYLDGVHPSIVMCRGYYDRAALRAYTWDGNELSLQWEYDAKSGGIDSLYGQGNHNLSVADVDNDGKDEIVYGSACLDDDGKTVLGNTQLGHGDAIHVSDFNNDGIQEAFTVKEKSGGYKKFAEDLRVIATGEHFWPQGKIVTSGDNGRGVMANIDDAYAKANANALAIGWSSGFENVHDLNGDTLKAKPSGAGKGSFDNFLVYWDGDLGRELLDANIIQKYDAATGTTKRFWGESDGYTLTGAYTNNYTKRTPCLVADLFGDWREEIIMAAGRGQAEKPALRIFTSTIPTDYRLTTLMHDSQYRMSVVWQNVAYNQPTHTSYYVGSAAIATNESGKELNYLAPAVPYTKVTYDAPAHIDVSGIKLSTNDAQIELGKTLSIKGEVLPSDATKKGITWTSSNPSVATIVNGTVKAVGDGTATITATTKGTAADGTTTFSETCNITVYSKPVSGVFLSDKVLNLGMNSTASLIATVTPNSASDKSVTWKSENPAIASVDANGTVTGKGYGKTKIIATTNYNSISAECIVNVKPIDRFDVSSSSAFEFANPNTDLGTKLSASANSAALTQKDAADGTIVQKSFDVVTSGTATLNFRFTTGGQRLDGSNWNWSGHEYTVGLRFLDASGNSILDIAQPYTGSAQATQSSVMGGSSAELSKDWVKTAADGENPIQRSTTRWCISLDFDYDANSCTATLAGATSEWVRGVEYQKTFDLNDVNFKTLQVYTTKNGSGTITVSPSLENLTYTQTKGISGNTENIFEAGSAASPWTTADIDGWVQTNQNTAALSIIDGRLGYNPIAPTAAYSAKKTFDITAGAIVLYDVDWHTGLATGRDGNIEYLQFGNAMRLGWDNGYKLKLSTDKGATWAETPIYTGSNTEFTKNVKAIFNTATGNVTLWFDGSKVADYTYRQTAAPDTVGADSVEFGFTRAGAAASWAHPNSIERIRVSQFIAGDDMPDISAIQDVRVDNANPKKAIVNYSLVNYDKGSISVIGVLYDENGAIIEIKPKTITNPKVGVFTQETFDFDNNASDYTLKVFIWDSFTSMKALCERGIGLGGKTPVSSPTPNPGSSPTPLPSTPTPTPSTPTPSPSAPTPTPSPATANLSITYVDHDNATAATGFITEGLKVGYNSLSNNVIGFGNTGWGSNWITYVKVDVSDIINEGTQIKSAKLKFEGSGSTDSKRNANIGVGSTPYTAWDDGLTYEIASSAETNMTTITPIGSTIEGSSKSATGYDSYEFDVSDSLKTDADGIVTFAIYNLQAAGSTLKNISMDIETTSAKMATVTLKYVNVEGQTIAEDFVTKSEVGSAYPLAAKDTYTIVKDGVKYAYNAAQSSVSELVKEDDTTVLTLVYSEENKYLVTINAVGNDSASLGSVFEGFIYANETATIPYSRYLINNGKLYMLTPKGGDKSLEYNHYVNVTTSAVTENITYAKQTETGVFYQEAETLLNEVAVVNSAIRCSMGKGGTVDAKTEILTLTAGTYKISSAVWGGGKTDDKQTKYVITAGNTALELTTSSSWICGETAEFTLTTDTVVTVEAVAAGSEPASSCLDYILITGTGSAAAITQE